jgi:putative transposase
MAKAARTPRAGMSYVATATHDRRPIFEISRAAELFVDTLLHYRTLGHYKLHAYVVMPDLVHLLLTPQSISLDQALALIKNGFVHRLDTELPIWQESYTAYSVANNHDLEVARAYLHQLPVRASLASAAELYPHSSAYRQAPATATPASRSPPQTPANPASAEGKSRKSTKRTATSLRKVAP